jgi:hypothetical protein
MITTDLTVKLAVGIAAALAVAYAVKNVSSMGSAAVNAAGNAAAGAVLGTGDLLGIPRTNTTQCQADTSAGNTWAASFSCSAGDFTKYVMYGTATPNTGGANGQW